MQRTYVEWIVEELVGEEIVDVNHGSSYAEVCGWVGAGEHGVFRFGLVRDYCSTSAPIIERSWSYVVDGLLSPDFTDSYGNSVAKVAQRYHRELAKFHLTTRFCMVCL